MPDIIIPKKLNDRLSLDSIWQPVVTTLKEKVKKIIKESPYFFPDYTDHGIDHINEVLALADRLISEETYTSMVTDTEYLLDSRSVGFLVCAILIHDLGMFLKTDSIEQLVYGRHRANLLKDLDETNWEKIWTKYMEKFRRMKDNEKEHLFGRIVHISADPARQGSSITEDERRIIGEFLRQNHGRLAHEIAVHGFPGDQEIMLITGDGITDDDRDMIGLLARSHQMNIRDTEEYIERFGEGSKPYGIPAFYLMAVLRMADYLDASEKRAPEILERIQKIRVPASSKEWSWNKCISKGPKLWELQKHNLVIHANPTKSTEYVLLDNWLRSVQAELDLCWSIIADQYSGEAYRLTIHRVLSNIHQKKPRENFNRKFLTKEAKITANPAIVKLMMEPLYGNDPTYGVRELLQNAVDACLEREQWEKTHKEGDPNYKGLVDIRIENDVFTITDNGMGMNEDVLLNYYLSAGSSYRSSDAWMAANAPNGKSQVARTGKFGVGFLAAFLLGDEVEVLTHHRDDQMGYHFFFDQDSKTLDVKRLVRKEYGTTITIKLKPGVYDKLQKGLDPQKEDSWYMWYAFDDPMVTYHFDGKLVSSPHETIPRIPDANCSWFRLDSKQYENYLWAYKKSQKFFCNGLYIPHYRQFRPVRMGADHGLSLDAPSVSVMDPNGSLQVNLQRTSVLTFPEESTLLQELYRYVIAGLLVSKWDYSLGCRIFHNDWTPCLQRPGGFLPNHPAFRSTAKVTRFLALCFCDNIPYDRGSEAPILPHFLTEDIPFMLLSPASFFSRNLTNTFEHQIPYLLKPFVINSGMDTYFDYQSVGVNYWLSQKAYACLHNDSFFELKLDTHLVESDAVFEDSVLKWRLADLPLETSLWSYAVTKGIDQTSRMTLEFFAERRAAYSACQMPIDPTQYPSDQFAFAVDCVTHDQNPDHPSLFSEMLSRYLGPDPWIPYSLEERESKFPDAFTELRPYIDYCKAHPYS